KLVSRPPEKARTMGLEPPGSGTGDGGPGKADACDMKDFPVKNLSARNESVEPDVDFYPSPVPGPRFLSFAANAAITAFCTCSRFSASSIAMQFGESITASVALTLRRRGRQWENTPSLVSAIFASSTMKCLKRSRMGFSASQLPKYGSAPQLLA